MVFKSNQNLGFSLMELLVAVVIMTLMISVSIPAMGSLSQSRQLNSWGNHIVDLANMARQNAMAKNRSTALVIVNNSGDQALDGRLFCLMEHVAGTGWTPLTPWRLMPDTLRLDDGYCRTYFTQTPVLDGVMPTLKYRGRDLGAETYRYQVFTADGSMETSGLSQATSPVLRFIPTRGNTDNYYDITLNLYTGQFKVDRP